MKKIDGLLKTNVMSAEIPDELKASIMKSAKKRIEYGKRMRKRLKKLEKDLQLN